MLERPLLNGEVNFPLCLAPMVGLSHAIVRSIISEYVPPGAQTLWPTEMLNSRKLPHENFAQVPECLRYDWETNLVPQILGNNETEIAKSIQRLETEWGASAIDINMGCPVQKALKHNYGVALMGDVQYAADVVRMTVRNTRLPVSVKLRVPEAEQPEAELLKFGTSLVSAGASWLTLHPRTPAQKRRGKANKNLITRLREEVPVAVIGNGDVQNIEDINLMLDETQCDSVMVGRALMARPWMFWQLGRQLGWPSPRRAESCNLPQTRNEEANEFGYVCKRFIQLLPQTRWSENLGIRKFRFFLKNAAPYLNFGHTLEAQVSRTKSYVEIEQVLASFFAGDNELEMAVRTDLRF